MMKVISSAICLIWLCEVPETHIYLHIIPLDKHEVQSQTAFCSLQYNYGQVE